MKNVHVLLRLPYKNSHWAQSLLIHPAMLYYEKRLTKVNQKE
jgi:hypothetical protein